MLPNIASLLHHIKVRRSRAPSRREDSADRNSDCCSCGGTAKIVGGAVLRDGKRRFKTVERCVLAELRIFSKNGSQVLAIQGATSPILSMTSCCLERLSFFRRASKGDGIGGADALPKQVPEHFENFPGSPSSQHHATHCFLQLSVWIPTICRANNASPESNLSFCIRLHAVLMGRK